MRSTIRMKLSKGPQHAFFRSIVAATVGRRCCFFKFSLGWSFLQRNKDKKVLHSFFQSIVFSPVPLGIESPNLPIPSLQARCLFDSVFLAPFAQLALSIFVICLAGFINRSNSSGIPRMSLWCCCPRSQWDWLWFWNQYSLVDMLRRKPLLLVFWTEFHNFGKRDYTHAKNCRRRFQLFLSTMW